MGQGHCMRLRTSFAWLPGLSGREQGAHSAGQARWPGARLPHGQAVPSTRAHRRFCCCRRGFRTCCPSRLICTRQPVHMGAWHCPATRVSSALASLPVWLGVGCPLCQASRVARCQTPSWPGSPSSPLCPAPVPVASCAADTAAHAWLTRGRLLTARGSVAEYQAHCPAMTKSVTSAVALSGR